MCNFEIEFKGSAKELVERAKKGIEDNKGTFSGDTSNGTFELPILTSAIKGNYSIKGQTITINITSKPFLVSCSQIETKLEKLLGEGERLTTLLPRSVFPASAEEFEGFGIQSDPNSLEQRVASTEGCVGFLRVLQVCYKVEGFSVVVSLKIAGFPVGEITLNTQNTCGTLGGSAAGFTAEVKVCFDFSELLLSIEGKACAPIVGCKKGGTDIRF